jgi:impB/mucB/samB family
LAHRLKQRIAKNIGIYITCSIGFAANRLLAKIACKVDKHNGVTIWGPEAMPGPLLKRPMSDVGCPTDMAHALLVQPLGQFLRDVAGAVVGQQSGFVLDTPLRGRRFGLVLTVSQSSDDIPYDPLRVIATRPFSFEDEFGEELEALTRLAVEKGFSGLEFKLPDLSLKTTASSVVFTAIVADDD